jgi:hypothetical protein
VNLHRTEIFAGDQNMVDSVTDKQGVNMHVCSWRGAKRSSPQQDRFTRIKLKDQIKQQNFSSLLQDLFALLDRKMETMLPVDPGEKFEAEEDHSSLLSCCTFWGGNGIYDLPCGKQCFASHL